MAPTVHLIRHAQGYHNLSEENESIRDPKLAEEGEKQCADLRASFPAHDKVVKLIASPLYRTLHTCILSVGRDELYPITALDYLQEVSNVPSDTGSDIKLVKEKFGDKVDLTRVEKDWTDKGEGSIHRPTLDTLTTRAAKARNVLREELAGLNEDDHMAVVLHGSFLHFLTDDWQDHPEDISTNWENCEFRSYQFTDPSGKDDDAAITETFTSWERRRGQEKQPTPEQQKKWREKAHAKLGPALAAKE